MRHHRHFAGSIASSVEVRMSPTARVSPAQSTANLAPSHRRALAGLPLVLLLALCAPFLTSRTTTAAPPPDVPAADWSLSEGVHFRYAVAPNQTANAETFVAFYGETLERAYSELSLFFAFEPVAKIDIRAYADGTAVDLARQVASPPPLPGIAAVADAESLVIALNVTSFLGLSEREADTALRHAVAQILVGGASGFNIPPGFSQGAALYAERPTTPQMARYAALLADANGRPPLPSWFDLNRTTAAQELGEILAAEAYSVMAFLIDRYTISTFQNFLKNLRTEADWRLAMRTAYTRDPTEIETAWAENVSRWVIGEWRNNFIAAFDLTPAQELFAEARYAEAKTTLERSQLLYAGLGDRGMLAEVQDLLLQCDTGLQAESLMQQAREALERHSYDRAQALLLQAREQYSRLPDDHQPVQLLTTYETLATSGLAAGTSLSEAQRLGRQWGDSPDAREQAVTAGTTFSTLGDEAMRDRADGVLTDLDARQRRLVLMLGALGLITAAWLALWLWARGPTELDWS